MVYLRPSFTYFALAAVVTATPTNLSCRCTSGSACWPTQADFDALAESVSQPLLYPTPPASPCYPLDDPSGNCTDVQLGWFNGIWRSNHSGAMQNINYETFTYPNGTIDACYFNTTLGFPCEQGSVPVIGVDSWSAEDVQAAVSFAAEHNLRVVVKNTGHDFLGRSTARDSFLIWTHNMKNITFHETFTPTGAESSVVYENAFTLGSGVQWNEAYAAAAAHDRVLVGGVSREGSIGTSGGWVSGGGHSLLSPNYGLGVDNVLELTIVTADGDHLTVNSYTYPDLFWAIRGGGGGTYGVLTSVTYRSHPPTPFISCYFSATSATPDSPNLNLTQSLLAELVRLTPSLVDQGFGGYGFIDRSGALTFNFSSPNVTWEQANETFLPFFEYAASLAEEGGLIVENFTVPMDSFYAVLSPIAESDPQVGYNLEISSWLLPAEVFGDPEALAAQLMELYFVGYCLITGGEVSRVDPESTGLNPAWRRSLAYTVTGTAWSEGASADEIEATREAFRDQMAKLESIAPDSGAYLNEASLYEFDFKHAFFGSHYDRLKEIKLKYDPDSLFIVWEGVGSEDWDDTLNCRLRD